jgi:predicted GNAT family N-acyltransferase
MECKCILNKNVAASLLEEIIILKEESWPYGIQSQEIWIKENIKDNDVHFCCFDENEYLYSYANLVQRSIKVMNQEISVFGIGNVCVRSKLKGKGFGIELMNNINQFLIESNKVGALFCKESLVNFYLNAEWILIKNQNLLTSFDKSSSFFFLYNIQIEDEVSVELIGESF